MPTLVAKTAAPETETEPVEFQIEKNIPIPSKHGRTIGFTASLRKLEVGDSFWYSKLNVSGMLGNPALKRLNRTFLTRREGSGMRIWRTS